MLEQCLTAPATTLGGWSSYAAFPALERRRSASSWSPLTAPSGCRPMSGWRSWALNSSTRGRGRTSSGCSGSSHGASSSSARLSSSNGERGVAMSVMPCGKVLVLSALTWSCVSSMNHSMSCGSEFVTVTGNDDSGGDHSPAPTLRSICATSSDPAPGSSRSTIRRSCKRSPSRRYGAQVTPPPGRPSGDASGVAQLRSQRVRTAGGQPRAEGDAASWVDAASASRQVLLRCGDAYAVASVSYRRAR